MSAADLDSFLDELSDAGVTVHVDGGTLRVKGPTSVLTPEMRAGLAKYKTDIINRFTPPTMMHKDITRGRIDTIKVTIDACVNRNGLNEASVGGSADGQAIHLTAFFGTQQEADAAYCITKAPVRLTSVTAIIDGKEETKLFESDAEADQHVASLEQNVCPCGSLTRSYRTASAPAECAPCSKARRDADPAKWVLTDGSFSGDRRAVRVAPDGFHDELVKVWHHTPKDFRGSVYD